ncbi:MAG: GAF domain-containing protein [Limisphaerales bacterium]
MTTNDQPDYERLKLLYEVSKVIHSTLDPQEALQLILREAVKLLNASSGSVALLNPTTGCLEIEAGHGLPDDALSMRLRMNEGITGWVSRKGAPARVADVLEDDRYVAVAPGVRSELAVPLFVDGNLRGVLNMDSEQVDAFTLEDQVVLEELVVQASRVIHNTWLYEQVRHKARLSEGLLSIGQAVNSTLNLDDTLDIVTREAAGLMNAKVCSLQLLNEEESFLELRSCHGGGASYHQRPPLNISESLIGTVIRRRKPVQELSVQTSGRYQHVSVAHDEGLVSLLSVPMIFSQRIIGALNVYTGQPHIFSDEEVRILATLADLSAVAIEKARLYERIVDVEEQLRHSEQLSAIGILAAEVAHEIRNPLTVMKMLFHSMDLKFDHGDPRNEDAKIMGEKIDHLGRIVDRILDFARRSEPNLTEVDANQLIDDLGLLTRHRLKSEHIDLQRELSTDLPLIKADATQLEQAFLNLTLNAVEAMPEGGSLTVSTRSLADGIEVRFSDTGPGMSADQQQAAFSSWFTAGKEEGTGLGLAIVARVIDGHGGRISIESKSGDGTTFVIQLPFEPPPKQSSDS